MNWYAINQPFKIFRTVDIASTIATIFEYTHPNTDGRSLDEIFVDGKQEVQNDFIPINEKNEGQSPFHKFLHEKNIIRFQKHIFFYWLISYQCFLFPSVTASEFCTRVSGFPSRY